MKHPTISTVITADDTTPRLSSDDIDTPKRLMHSLKPAYQQIETLSGIDILASNYFDYLNFEIEQSDRGSESDISSGNSNITRSGVGSFIVRPFSEDLERKKQSLEHLINFYSCEPIHVTERIIDNVIFAVTEKHDDLDHVVEAMEASSAQYSCDEGLLRQHASYILFGPNKWPQSERTTSRMRSVSIAASQAGATSTDPSPGVAIIDRPATLPPKLEGREREFNPWFDTPSVSPIFHSQGKTTTVNTRVPDPGPSTSTPKQSFVTHVKLSSVSKALPTSATTLRSPSKTPASNNVDPPQTHVFSSADHRQQWVLEPTPQPSSESKSVLPHVDNFVIAADRPEHVTPEIIEVNAGPVTPPPEAQLPNALTPVSSTRVAPELFASVSSQFHIDKAAMLSSASKAHSRFSSPAISVSSTRPRVKKEPTTPSISISRNITTCAMRSFVDEEGVSREASYFIIASSGPIAEPPKLNIRVKLGDVLFNKTPDMRASLHFAQVWLYNRKAAPGYEEAGQWEDITAFYSSFSKKIKHPTVELRYLSCAPSDGKPGWVKLATWHNNMKRVRSSSVEIVEDEHESGSEISDAEPRVG